VSRSAGRHPAVPVVVPILACAVLAAVALASCVSTGDDRLLLRMLDASAKADALTDAGIEQYTARLTQRGEYGAVQEVRAYFDLALRYDPSNARAKKYLDLVDTYLAARLKASVKEADRLLAKKTRTRNEDWLMVAAVQKAALLDPQNEDVRRLAAETTTLRDTLVKEGIAQERATVDKITDTTATDDRDRLWVDGYLAAGRVLALDAKNPEAQAEQARTRRQVEDAFARRLAGVRALLKQLKFTASKAEIAEMSALSRRSGGLGESEVRTATYELNYQWARWLYDQKEYASADVRVKAAIAVQRSADAAALQKRITEALARTTTGVSYDESLKDIDRLIGAGELVAAQNRLEALERTTTEKARLAELDARRERIRAFLADLYARGLTAYREENFAEAIEALETVVRIDVGYEQAADYLEKARSKQRLLEQY
jgi:hypothetical protein